ncbi:hypothetical protein SRCM100730_03128 [Bacillus velezensis]|nr:hypothetical protein S100072_01632 [Bacillus velezensis]OBR34813.1 hypothetical protein SRCM100731_00185 [Bacillus velezensis]OCB94703.1 hypothetical protein SRCM100730_03128 [Bacillus velezensis]QHK04096.1 hypothetical protein C7M18_02993 [Bacillus velezensis]
MGKRKSSPRLATTSFIDAVTLSLDRNVNMYTRFHVHCLKECFMIR